ncbi:NFATC2-interacting protein-like isoform X2 [Ostrea edulis]|nr:NFATC2-interacting protein-like isoform X2 [Ostrea edulis]
MLNKRGISSVLQFQCLLSGDDSDENDDDVICNKKAKSKTQTREVPELCTVISDDEEELRCTPLDKLPSVIDCIKSPSPPPPPEPLPLAPILTKQPSMTRAMKKAMKQLSEAKSYLQKDSAILNTSCQDTDDVICLDDSHDENSIFFFVQCNAELKKHRMGKWEPFKTLVDTLSIQQNIPVSDIMLSLNDVTVHPSETPSSVKLKSADILVMYKNSGKDVEAEDINLSGIQLFVQSRNSKKKLEFKIDPMAPLQVLINKYCIQIKTDPGNYHLQFDGEDVRPQDTPTDLDLEEGYCLDIIETT